MNIKISPLTRKHVASYLAQNFPEIGPVIPQLDSTFCKEYPLDLPDASFQSHGMRMINKVKSDFQNHHLYSHMLTKLKFKML